MSLRGGHRFAVFLLGVAVILAPLYRGGVDWPFDVACAVVAGAAFLIATSSHMRDPPDGRSPSNLSWAELALAVVTLVIALQLLPLPAALLRFLSPGAHDVFERALQPIGLYPAARPISLDPGSTARELCKAAAWSLAFAASALLTRVRRGSQALLVAVAGAGAAAGALALGASLLGRGALTESRAVFVNPNHLAGLLGLGAWPALGFALRSRGATRLAWLVAFALSTLEIFLTLSRGGIGGLCVGAVVFAVLMVRRGAPNPHRRPTNLVAPFIAVGLAVAFAAVLALSPLFATLRTVRGAPFEAKIAMWPVALRMAREYPAFGIGRGAYLTAYAAYERDPTPFTFTHVENEWIQTPLELGLPGGLLLIGTFAWVWLAAVRARSLSRPMVGALAGTAALAAHNFFDFSLELTGVALPFAVAMGVLSWQRREVSVPGWAIRPAALLLVVLGLGGMAVNRRHTLDGDVARVQEASDEKQLEVAARRALQWHPADYVTPATVGARLTADRNCQDALPWLVRAMERKPTAPEPHRFAARCLTAALPDSPAGAEYRLAFLLGDREALREAARRYKKPGALLAIAPQTADGLIAAGDSSPYSADAVAAYTQAWELFREPEALSRLCRLKLQAGETVEALNLAHLLERTSPRDITGYLVAASALAQSGASEGASTELEEAAGRFPGNDQVLMLLAQTYASRQMYAEARAALERIEVRTARGLHDKLLYIGTTYEQAGQLGDAIREYESAHRALPTDPRSLDALARIARRLGRHDEEIAYLRQAEILPGVDRAAYEARIVLARKQLEMNSQASSPP